MEEEIKFKDTNVKFVSIDFKIKKEIKNEKKNSGMNTPEENKLLSNWETNTKKVMCGCVSNLMNIE